MARATKTAHTIPQDIADEIRRDAKQARRGRFWTQWSTTSEGEICTATGRARCRCCGEKIAKGLVALRVFSDRGAGTWTAVWEYLHAEGCAA